MSKNEVHVNFAGKIVFVGFGSIGQGVLPLILRHIGTSSDRITIVHRGKQRPDRSRAIRSEIRQDGADPGELPPGAGTSAQRRGLPVEFIRRRVERRSHSIGTRARRAVSRYLHRALGQQIPADPTATVDTSQQVHHAPAGAGPARPGLTKARRTAVLTHGSQPPGWFRTWSSRALLNIAKDTGVDAGSAQQPRFLGEARPNPRHPGHSPSPSEIPQVHECAEGRRTSSSIPGPWTASSAKGLQPAELGWGTHAESIPAETAPGTRWGQAARSAAPNRPGAATRVRTWTPQAGHFHRIPHHAPPKRFHWRTTTPSWTASSVAYHMPTTHYAHITRATTAVLSVHEFAGNNWHLQDHKRIMLNEITAGIDELGVLLAGHEKNAYWYGSQLSIEEARKLAPYNSATSLQVTAAALSGMIWAMEETRTAASSSRMTWNSSGRSRSACLTQGTSSASTRTGPRCISAASYLPRTSTAGRPLAVQEHPGGLVPTAPCAAQAGDG